MLWGQPRGALGDFLEISTLLIGTTVTLWSGRPEGPSATLQVATRDQKSGSPGPSRTAALGLGRLGCTWPRKNFGWKCGAGQGAPHESGQADCRWHRRLGHTVSPNLRGGGWGTCRREPVRDAGESNPGSRWPLSLPKPVSRRWVHAGRAPLGGIVRPCCWGHRAGLCREITSKVAGGSHSSSRWWRGGGTPMRSDVPGEAVTPGLSPWVSLSPLGDETELGLRGPSAWRGPAGWGVPTATKGAAWHRDQDPCRLAAPGAPGSSSPCSSCVAGSPNVAFPRATCSSRQAYLPAGWPPHGPRERMERDRQSPVWRGPGGGSTRLAVRLTWPARPQAGLGEAGGRGGPPLALRDVCPPPTPGCL